MQRFFVFAKRRPAHPGVFASAVEAVEVAAFALLASLWLPVTRQQSGEASFRKVTMIESPCPRNFPAVAFVSSLKFLI